MSEQAYTTTAELVMTYLKELPLGLFGVGVTTRQWPSAMSPMVVEFSSTWQPSQGLPGALLPRL